MQLPLPDHIDHLAVLSQVSVDKDVDGFHPENVGSLAVRGREPLFVPCTPLVIDFTSPHLFFSLRFLSDRLSAFRSSPFPGLPNASGAQWHQHRRKACCDLGAKQRRGTAHGSAAHEQGRDSNSRALADGGHSIPHQAGRHSGGSSGEGRDGAAGLDKGMGRGKVHIFRIFYFYVCVCVLE